MGKLKITTVLSIIVTFSGAIVMIGWILDIGVLKSILPIWVTMKFTTALSFFFSGIILYIVTSISSLGRSDFSQIALSFAVLIILLFMMTLLFSSVLYIRTGVEDFFVVETENTIQTIISGRPSIGTMINFILVSAIGLFKMNDFKKIYEKTVVIGILITIIGSIAILGYVFSIPSMYCVIEGVSSGMAVHTAILFIIIGICFFLNKENNTILVKQK